MSTEERNYCKLSDLIEALQIILKYGDIITPIWYDDDELHIGKVDTDKISEKDAEALEILGFSASEFDSFHSYQYISEY